MPTPFRILGICLLLTWMPLSLAAQAVIDDSTSVSGEHIGVGEDSLDFMAQSFIADGVELDRLEIWVRKDSGGGNIAISLMAADASGLPDPGNVLYAGNASSPGAGAGQWIFDNNIGLPLTVGQKYFVIADGFQHPGGSGFSAVGTSSQFTDTGEDALTSSDGGATWDTLFTERMAIRVWVIPCPQTVELGIDTVEYCAGNPPLLDAGGGFNSYTWNTGDTTQTLQTTGPGLYTILVTDSTGCGSRDSVRVLENPLPDPGLDSLYITCPGEGLFIDASGGFLSYLWSDGLTNAARNFTDSSFYWLEVTDTNGCVARDSFEYAFFTLPDLDIGGDTLVCENDFIEIGTGPGFVAWQWNTGSTDSVVQPSFTGPIYVQVTDSNGCVQQSDTIQVTIYPVPGVPTVTRSGNTLTSTFGFTYQWYLDGQILTGQTGQSISPSASGNYTVVVSNGFGCTTESAPFEFLTEIDPDRIPNAFSPNGDGYNDIFFIENIEFFSEAEFVVFNRWGQKVFESVGYANDWDGRGIGGGMLPDGNYWYTLDLKMGDEPITGIILIHR